jgi:hypothetical protein
MRVSLADIPIYCLTCEDESFRGSNETSRKNHMESEWARVGVTGEFVYPIYGGISKNKSGASGFFRMIERGLRAQTPGTPFTPFLMLEDDISFAEGSLMVADIPDDADILYVGLSNCSMNDHQFHYDNYYTSMNGFPEVVRIKHMLATHGIMVCSALGAAAIQRSMIEIFLCDKPWDIPLAFLQPYYRVYALRRPWVYQDSGYGGDEACTRITLEGADKELPENWVNGTWATIRMGEQRTS